VWLGCWFPEEWSSNLCIGHAGNFYLANKYIFVFFLYFADLQCGLTQIKSPSKLMLYLLFYFFIGQHESKLSIDVFGAGRGGFWYFLGIILMWNLELCLGHGHKGRPAQIPKTIFNGFRSWLTCPRRPKAHLIAKFCNISKMSQ